MSEQTYTPPPITGYRELSQSTVDLMNRIKAHEATTMALVREVNARIDIQHVAAAHMRVSKPKETERMKNAEPNRWASIARTDFQTGYMALVRAVAQPVTP